MIIPAYNAASSIVRAIGSVRAQTGGGPREILVVDDHSTDATPQLVNALAGEDRRIRLLHNERRPGPAGARNTGLRQALGDYITFLDADDEWLPNHLEEGLSFLDRRRDVDAVLFDFEIRDGETGAHLGDWFATRRYPNDLRSAELEGGYRLILGNLFRALVEENFLHLQAMVFRRRALEGLFFDEDLARSEDRDFCIRLHREARARLAYRRLVTGIYYRYPGSRTAHTADSTIQNAQGQIQLFRRYLEEPGLDPGLAELLRARVYRRYLELVYAYREAGRWQESLEALRESLRYGHGAKQVTEVGKLLARRVLRPR